MALVGVGVDHTALSTAARHFKFRENKRAVAPGSGYQGGEVRVDKGGELVSAAVVTEGASMESKDLVALSVLQQIMGTGPHVKYSGDNATSRVGKAAAAATSNPVAVSPLKCLSSCPTCI